MPTTKFSDFSLLWPFANELDQTLFIYKEQEKGTPPHVPPNDEMTICALSTALGNIAMDDSSPDFYLVGQRDAEYHKIKSRRHLIYIGGEIRNKATGQFLSYCDQKNIKRIVNLPFSKALPRVMKIINKDISIDLTTCYYDLAKKQVKTDYGLALLVTNPFATKDTWKVLLVAGNHSYGTLAAARAISSLPLSAEITRRILSNFHLPPHLLGIIEIVVRVEVDKKGRLCEENIEYLFINEQSIPINLYENNQLKTNIKFTTTKTTIVRDTNSLKISFKQKFGSEVATPITKVENTLLNKEFFNFFSERVIIVVSPHSDDSAIGCGGLIYYLRNKKLWQLHGKKGKKECPPVHVLVMKESPKEAVTTDYLNTYCTNIGFKEPLSEESVVNNMKAAIRFNESKAEAMLLDTDSYWLQLDKLKELDKKRGEKEDRKTIVDYLRKIVRTYKSRTPLFLIPQLTDLHPTHKHFAELLLDIFQRLFPAPQEKEKKKEKRVEVWTYETPWSTFDPLNIYDINIIIPLDKHAMFAKCQAISMHQSQEIRTRFSDVARTHSKRIAEILPEMLFGFGRARLGWDYIEVFSSRVWAIRNFSKKL